MKVCMIIPYFGSLPKYFSIFLKSCSQNPTFNWLIFTDDTTLYFYPENVKLVKMNFEECQRLIQSKFNFNISLSRPNKLCDYRCAYGYIFEDYIRDFDFWGHCDTDQVFGNLSSFITDEVLMKYDKLFSLGHLTLYRNVDRVNMAFMLPLNGKPRYKEVFTTDAGCAFDEWYANNINEIFLLNNFSFYPNNICADIDSYHSKFVLNVFDFNKKQYFQSRKEKCIFKWQNGTLYRVILAKDKLSYEEYPYIHLQKRKMSVRNLSLCLEAESFYIVPNKFIVRNKDMDDSQLIKFLKLSAILSYFNFQYFRVKYNSFKSRIKTNSLFKKQQRIKFTKN